MPGGVEITELSTHPQGRLVAVHPAYDSLFDTFGAAGLRRKRAKSAEWAARQVKYNAKASRRQGLDAIFAFSGALAFRYLYPLPPRAPGLIDEAFTELSKRWIPVSDACDPEGVDGAVGLHPGEDLFDGATFEMMLDKLGEHK